MKTIDISNLIQKAEELAYDGRLEMAEEANMPIQILELEGGSKYQICLIAKFLPQEKTAGKSHG